jgi:hypothetical protein
LPAASLLQFFDGLAYEEGNASWVRRFVNDRRAQVEAGREDLGQGRRQDDALDVWVVGSVVDGPLQRVEQLEAEGIDLRLILEWACEAADGRTGGLASLTKSTPSLSSVCSTAIFAVSD